MQREFGRGRTTPGATISCSSGTSGSGRAQSRPGYFNAGGTPDPDPSPDVNLILATDAVSRAFPAAGTFTVTLAVYDDDGGIAIATLTVRTG